MLNLLFWKWQKFTALQFRIKMFFLESKNGSLWKMKELYNYFKRLSFFFFFVLFVCLVYADGRVCISILHAPGDDPMGYETSAERWSPVQSVEKILLSVVSMLAGMLIKHVLCSFARNQCTFLIARNLSPPVFSENTPFHIIKGTYTTYFLSSTFYYLAMYDI